MIRPVIVLNRLMSHPCRSASLTLSICSRDGSNGGTYDTILVMGDRLMKYTHFVQCKATISARQLGFLVIDRLIRHHEIPRVLVINTDKLFTSRCLPTPLDIDHKMSLTLHHEIDRQMKRSKQALKAHGAVQPELVDAKPNMASPITMSRTQSTVNATFPRPLLSDLKSANITIRHHHPTCLARSQERVISLSATGLHVDTTICSCPTLQAENLVPLAP